MHRAAGSRRPVAGGAAIGGTHDLGEVAQATLPIGRGQTGLLGHVHGDGAGRPGEVRHGEVGVVKDRAEGRRGRWVQRAAAAALDQDVGVGAGQRGDAIEAIDVHRVRGIADGRRTSDVDLGTGHRRPDGAAEDRAAAAGDRQVAPDGQRSVGAGLVDQGRVRRHTHIAAAESARIAGNEGAGGVVDGTANRRATCIAVGAGQPQGALVNGGRTTVGVAAVEDQGPTVALGQRVGRRAIGNRAAELQHIAVDVDRAGGAGVGAQGDRAGAEVEQGLATAMSKVSIDRDRIVVRVMDHRLGIHVDRTAIEADRAGAGRSDAVEPDSAGVEYQAAAEGIGTGGHKTQILIAGFDQRQGAGVVLDRCVESDSALVAGGNVEVGRRGAVLADDTRGRVDGPGAVGIVQHAKGLEVILVQGQRIVATDVAQGRNGAGAREGLRPAAAAKLDGARGVGVRRIGPGRFRRSRDTRREDPARGVIDRVVAQVAIVVASRGPAADDLPRRSGRGTGDLDHVRGRVGLSGGGGEGDDAGGIVGQPAEGQHLAVVGHPIGVLLLIDVELAEVRGQRADGFGIVGVAVRAVVEVEHTAVAGQRDAVAEAVHEAFIGIAAGELQLALVESDPRGLGDRAALPSKLVVRLIDRGRAGVGIGAIEVDIAAASFGQAATAADGAVDSERLARCIGGQRVAAVIDVPENLNVVAVGAVLGPGLDRTQSHVGINVDPHVQAGGRETRGDAAAADRQLVAIGVDDRCLIGPRHGQALDAHVRTERHGVGASRVAEVVEEEIRADAGNQSLHGGRARRQRPVAGR